MRGNVLLAVMTLAITIFVMVPVLVSALGGGRPHHRHRHAGVPGSIPPTAVQQWHVHRIDPVDGAGISRSARLDDSHQPEAHEH